MAFLANTDPLHHGSIETCAVCRVRECALVAMQNEATRHYWLCACGTLLR